MKEFSCLLAFLIYATFSTWKRTERKKTVTQTKSESEKKMWKEKHFFKTSHVVTVFDEAKNPVRVGKRFSVGRILIYLSLMLLQESSAQLIILNDTNRDERRRSRKS